MACELSAEDFLAPEMVEALKRGRLIWRMISMASLTDDDARRRRANAPLYQSIANIGYEASTCAWQHGPGLPMRNTGGIDDGDDGARNAK